MGVGCRRRGRDVYRCDDGVCNYRGDLETSGREVRYLSSTSNFIGPDDTSLDVSGRLPVLVWVVYCRNFYDLCEPKENGWGFTLRFSFVLN